MIFTFNDKHRAIHINEPNLPQPWIHYLSNGRLHAFTSQVGGGFMWYKDPTLCRITRYRMHHLPIDRPGYYVYLCEDGEKAFNPTYQPSCTPVEGFESTFSPGMASFYSQRNNLAVHQNQYILPDEDVLVWDITLENKADKEKNVSVVAYTELSQLEWLHEQMYGYYWKHMLKTWFDKETQALYYLYHFTQSSNYLPKPLISFSGTEKIVSFSTDRDAFVGDYRDERNPVAIERGILGNEEIQSGEPCFAMQCKLKLAPKEIKRICFFLTIAEDGVKNFESAHTQMKAILTRIRNLDYLDTQKAKLSSQWKNYLEYMQCKLPDEQAERLINTWTPINVMTTARYSRAVNTLAPGVRGIGYRDSAQDMTAMAARDTDLAVDMLKTLLSKQFATGNAVHLIPLNPNEKPDAKIRCDSHLWLPFLVYAILAETGDRSLLSQVVPYLSQDDHLMSHGEGAVWEHLMRAVEFTERHKGSHGLPLTLHGDWNDIIGKFSQKGEGESVFAAQQYVTALRLLIEIAQEYSLNEYSYLNQCLLSQIKALQNHGFNGQWWNRCFDDEGNIVGCPQSEFGKLWLNPQSWAVISGTGTNEQNTSALDAVNKQLLTDVGLKLLTPGFKTYPEVQDAFVGYNPGNGENGAIFCHSNAWIIIAEALMGNGDRAWDYFSRLAPEKALLKMGLSTYKAEPYAWSSNIIGPENPKYGWANVTHVTGTAAWMDIAASQYLLGLRPKLSGLQIDPAIPKKWSGFSAQRLYRGCRLDIRVVNKSKSGHGVKMLTVNGVSIELLNGALIPAALIKGKKDLTVEVVL